MKLIAALLAFAAWSQQAPGPNFEENKKQQVEGLQKRISNLTEAKSCFEAATGPDAMKTCHEKLREEMKEVRMDRMEQKMGRMGKRMERMKEKSN